MSDQPEQRAVRIGWLATASLSLVLFSASHSQANESQLTRNHDREGSVSHTTNSAVDPKKSMFGIPLDQPFTLPWCKNMINPFETCRVDWDKFLKAAGILGALATPPLDLTRPWQTDIIYLILGEAYQPAYAFGVNELEMLNGKAQHLTVYTKIGESKTIAQLLSQKWGAPTELHDPKGLIWEHDNMRIEFIYSADWDDLSESWQQRVESDRYTLGGVIYMYTYEWMTHFSKWMDAHKKPAPRPL